MFFNVPDSTVGFLKFDLGPSPHVEEVRKKKKSKDMRRLGALQIIPFIEMHRSPSVLLQNCHRPLGRAQCREIFCSRDMPQTLQQRVDWRMLLGHGALHSDGT